MEMRKLGRSDISISALGMGCWAIGGPFFAGKTALGWGEVDDDESLRAIAKALELGVNFFDTADVYGAGHSERILARAFKGKQDKVVIATKFGNVFDEDTRQLRKQDGSPDYIRRACEASLRRLGRDWIDLYQFHINEYNSERAPEVRETLEELVQAGKIRAYAWSTDSPERARLFAAGKHCAAVQFTMNVGEDRPAMVALCEEQGLAGINRGPLAMGMLTGKFRSDSKLADSDVRGRDNSSAWQSYFKDGAPTQEWLERVAAVREALTADGRSLTQGAIGWLWARSKQLIPIPGFRTVQQVEENAGALRWGAIAAEQIAAAKEGLEGR